MGLMVSEVESNPTALPHSEAARLGAGCGGGNVLTVAGKQSQGGEGCREGAPSRAAPGAFSCHSPGLQRPPWQLLLRGWTVRSQLSYPNPFISEHACISTGDLRAPHIQTITCENLSH